MSYSTSKSIYATTRYPQLTLGAPSFYILPIASLHRPITQFCSIADLAIGLHRSLEGLQVLKPKFGRPASAQTEVRKACKCTNRSSEGLQVFRSKFGRSASVQIEVWKPARSTNTQNPKFYHFIICSSPNHPICSPPRGSAVRPSDSNTHGLRLPRAGSMLSGFVVMRVTMR